MAATSLGRGEDMRTLSHVLTFPGFDQSRAHYFRMGAGLKPAGWAADEP